MTSTIHDLATLLAQLQPSLQPGCFVYCQENQENPVPSDLVIASMREAEGRSLILAEADAQRLGLPAAQRCAWLTLTVHSDLAAVGLTAAVAAALAGAGLSCNMVAGLHHDHVFVPYTQADAALTVLRGLQSGGDAVVAG